ncbi:hypothetical protein ABVK25_002412 [Lepraria finkii]|uniref:Uncharacterized protein n=1 Tax=Lepraria finkii TaxID=1340010 RepID=A0ABR4BHR8_9LECA
MAIALPPPRSEADNLDEPGEDSLRTNICQTLALCGPTPQSLTWVGAFENSHSLNTFAIEDLIPRFSRLHKLKLAFIKFAD